MLCESLTESYYCCDIDVVGEGVDWALAVQNWDQLQAILKKKLIKFHAS